MSHYLLFPKVKASGFSVSFLIAQRHKAPAAERQRRPLSPLVEPPSEIFQQSFYAENSFSTAWSVSSPSGIFVQPLPLKDFLKLIIS